MGEVHRPRIPQQAELHPCDLLPLRRPGVGSLATKMPEGPHFDRLRSISEGEVRCHSKKLAITSRRRKPHAESQRRRPGFPFLDSQECFEITGSRLFRCAYRDPAGAQIHSPSLVTLIAKAAEKRSPTLQVIERLRVSAISPAAEEEKHNWVIETSGGVYYSKECVVACNGKMRHLIPSLEGVIIPVRAQVLVR